jgi:hypothetical protein
MANGTLEPTKGVVLVVMRFISVLAVVSETRYPVSEGAGEILKVAGRVAEAVLGIQLLVTDKLGPVAPGKTLAVLKAYTFVV